MHARKRAELQRLAEWLSIPLVMVDLRRVFDEEVLTPFVQTYRRGLTPNPCILCNPRVKFGALLDQAVRIGADRFATGHYARVVAPDERSPRYRLGRGRDRAKDQSYFLFGLTQRQLASTLFPLGDCFKRDVVAWGEGTPIAHLLSGESQEICFIPRGRYPEFLSERVGETVRESSGPIVDLEGRILGEHKGISAYTIGQRRGLGIASTTPHYVVGIDAATNTLRVGRAGDLSRSEIEVGSINWVAIESPSEVFSASVRIRNQHLPAPALVIPVKADRAKVRFKDPQRAVTPGQAAVFYDDDIVVGGGIIQPLS
jgi:tRNA-specific 2-thiouridylase